MMRIRLQQLNVTVGDLDENASAIVCALREAERSGVQLLILPELVTCGYPPMDLLERKAFLNAIFDSNEHIISQTADTALLFGTVRQNSSGTGRPVCNSAVFACAGKVVHEVQKTLLPTYDVFDEFRYFEPARQTCVAQWGGITWGITVCEDIWNHNDEYMYHTYDTDPALELRAQGAQVLVNISASPFTGKKPEIRQELLASHARRLGIPVLYANQVGANTELVFDGSGMAVSVSGEPVVRLASFEEDAADVILMPDGSLHSGDDVSEGGSGVTAPSPSTRKEVSGDDVSEGGSGVTAPSPSTRKEVSGDDVSEGGPVRKGTGYGTEERLFRALVLGLRDYVHKSRMSGKVVLGLSGGIDSALTAAIAAEALGAGQVTGVTMPSAFSSKGSVDDSEVLARNLGLIFNRISIEGLYGEFLKTLAPLFHGRPFDVAEENIQSRVRGTILMAISNKFGHMLLNTGNKSELAVGYCTLYGDMAGGLSVLSDVYKTEVFAISHWLNDRFYRREVIPRSTLEKPPSAELRPDQKDTDSLPEYEVLDSILRCYIEQQLSAAAIAEQGFDYAVVREVITLVDRNEYKRRQAAPGLRVTAKAFGSGRRLPIVQRWTEAR